MRLNQSQIRALFKTELEHLDEVEQIEILRAAIDALPATSPLILKDPYHYREKCGQNQNLKARRF